MPSEGISVKKLSTVNFCELYSMDRLQHKLGESAGHTITRGFLGLCASMPAVEVQLDGGRLVVSWGDPGGTLQLDDGGTVVSRGDPGETSNWMRGTLGRPRREPPTMSSL